MIEFFLGVGFGIFVRDVGGHVFEDDRDRMRAENRQLREALRYLRDVSPRSPVTRAYIDRVLDDEAGA